MSRVYNGPAMNEDGRKQGEGLVRCLRCDGAHDIEDNYCRHCGAALDASRLPMVRDGRSYALAPWRETLPVAVRGAAVVAVGTLAEAVLRRLIGRALRRGRSPSAEGRDGGKKRRLPARRQAEKAEPVESSASAYDDDRVVSETFLFRRVRLRRGGWPGE